MRTIRVKVKPGSRTSEIESLPDGSWLARVKSPPTDGKANAELSRLVAERFGVNRGAVVIKSGAGSRLKLVQIVD